MALNSSPIYNLGAVLKETGMAADTLRAWERRYGVPMPQRTPGGHRLYSERDIQLIKWLQGRQAEGMAISRAVRRWNELVASGSDPLAHLGSVGHPSQQFNSLSALREQWLAACLKFDEVTTEQILNQAYAQHSVEVVTREVIERALHEVGELWVRGQASVQQEHFLSALTMRRLDALISAAPPPDPAPVIVLACAEGEPHSLPLLHMNLLLRRRRRKVVFLGADVPSAEIADTARSLNAAIVVLCAQQLVTAVSLRDEAVLLAKKRIPVAYGGRIFSFQPNLQQHVAGTYLGGTIAEAVDRIEQMISEPPPANHRIPLISNEQAVAFREARARIEFYVHQHFAKSPFPSRLLTIANNYFGPALAAALDLGNIAYIEADMEWIQTLLAGHGLRLNLLRDYLLAYADAVRKVMGVHSAAISGWMRNYAAQVQAGA